MSVSSASSRGPQLQWAPELRTPSTEQENAYISDDEEEEGEEDYHEDWSRTTEDKDSFAAKERQRNIGHLKWKKIENYPKPTVPGQEPPRAGSILSVFEIGHQDGVKIPEDPEERREYERKRRLSSSGATKLEKIEDYPQLKKEYDEEGRMGSVLSVFVKKHQAFDDVIVVSEDKSQERRGSDPFEPSIEKIENYPRLSKEQKRPEGRHGSIFSALNDEREFLPADVSLPEHEQTKGERRSSSKVEKRPVIENYPENSHKRTTSGGLDVPIVSPRDARRGSVLSLWTTGSDDHQFDDVVEDKDSDKQSSRSSIGSKSIEGGHSRKARALSGSGQERHGSILSMWAPGKDKDGSDVMDHGDDDDIME